jgi:hypothetical protein
MPRSSRCTADALLPCSERPALALPRRGYLVCKREDSTPQYHLHPTTALRSAPNRRPNSSTTDALTNAAYFWYLSSFIKLP